jgi:hypothetical protein
MLRTILFTILILTVVILTVRSQTINAKESFRQHIIQEIKQDKLDSSNYFKKVIITAETLAWDTTKHKGFIIPIDTSDYTQLEIKHGPTRKKIISFIKLLDKEDYERFKEQMTIQNQDSVYSPIVLNGNKKSKNILWVSFSTPLFSKDEKTVLVKRLQKYSEGGFSQSTRIYTLKENKWVIWDQINSSALAY